MSEQFTPLPHFPQDSTEWHEQRARHIGASDIAAILGLSKHRTAREVYRAKMGAPNQIDENLAFFGHQLEEPLARWISWKHPEVGRIQNGFSAASIAHPIISAAPDRTTFVGDTIIPIELKTSSAWMKDEWEDGVPDYYYVQSIQQQGVLGAPHGWLAVLHGGNQPELFRIPFDQAVWQQIIDIGESWWKRHVVAEVEPEARSIAEFTDDKKNTGTAVEGDERLLMAWYLDGLARAAYKTEDERIEAVKNAFRELLGREGADELTYQGRALYTWKRSKDVISFDRAAFERDHPDLVQQYTRVVPGSVRFLRKTVKALEENPPADWAPGITVSEVLESFEELHAWKAAA